MSRRAVPAPERRTLVRVGDAAARAGPVTVRWEIAHDGGFKRIAGSGQSVAAGRPRLERA